MKICLISGGHLPIPSKGWGGVEVLITNYLMELKAQGHEVLVSNTSDLTLAQSTINEWAPDFVHLHYDGYCDMLPGINCKIKAITSHYPYIDYPAIAEKEGYLWIYEKLRTTPESYTFSLSDFNKETLISQGVSEDKIRVWNYGIPYKSFKFSETPNHADRSICLGKIEPRKRQSFLQTVDAGIDFAGPISDPRFWKDEDSYLGTWSRDQVHTNLTDYANLVLLSNGESAPQVVYEALMAGCGLVVSQEASANLNTDLPFIDVVDNSIGRFALRETIEKNREVSLKHRSEIREYGITNFSLETCVKNYVDMINSLR